MQVNAQNRYHFVIHGKCYVFMGILCIITANLEGPFTIYVFSQSAGPTCLKHAVLITTMLLYRLVMLCWFLGDFFLPFSCAHLHCPKPAEMLLSCTWTPLAKIGYSLCSILLVAAYLHKAETSNMDWREYN